MKIFNFLMIGLLTATVAVANVEMGAGSSGGGQVKDGKLRDLIERARLVEMKPGQDVVKDLPTFARILGVLRNGNVELSRRLIAEVNKTTFYFLDETLNDSALRNQDGVTKSKEIWEQAALRFNDDVYVSYSEFQKMDELNRGFLVLHEMLHGIVNNSTPAKIFKLRNFVYFVGELLRDNRTPSAAELLQLATRSDIKLAEFEASFRMSMREKDSVSIQAYIAQANLAEQGETMLYAAIEEDSAEAIRLLSAQGFDIDRLRIIEDDGKVFYAYKPLMYAAQYAKANAAKALIEAGADVNYIPDVGSYAKKSVICEALPIWNYATARDSGYMARNKAFADSLMTVRKLVNSGKLNLTDRRALQSALSNTKYNEHYGRADSKVFPRLTRDQTVIVQEIYELLLRTYGTVEKSWFDRQFGYDPSCGW